MRLTIRRPSPLCSALTQCILISLWHWIRGGLFINSMCPMPSSTMIWVKGWSLTKHVLMEHPLGYAVEGETTQVCHLHFKIYGLKQSPHAWFVKFNPLILSQGLAPCEVESTSVGCIILAIYVDHIGRNIFGITRVKAYLPRYLTFQDLGTPKYFLGIELAYRPGKLVLNQ